MTRRSRLAGFAVVLLSMVALSGCTRVEVLLLFPDAFTEEVPGALGGDYEEAKKHGQVGDALDEYVATGDASHLERARAVRPNDSNLLAHDFVSAQQAGDQDRANTARAELAKAEANAIYEQQGPPSDDDGDRRKQLVRDQANGRIARAYLQMLGHEWSGPLKEPTPEQQTLYDGYCAVRGLIQDAPSFLPLCE